MSNKAISVWLILSDGNNKGKIVLQKRSHLKGHSFPHVCLSAWAGKVEDNEKIKDAMMRECQEELGKTFAEKLDSLKIEMIGVEKFDNKGQEWESYNYLGKITQELLDLAEIHTEAHDEFIFVDKDSEIYPLSSGKDQNKHLVLFDDQYKIMKKILSQAK